MDSFAGNDLAAKGWTNISATTGNSASLLPWGAGERYAQLGNSNAYMYLGTDTLTGGSNEIIVGYRVQQTVAWSPSTQSRFLGVYTAAGEAISIRPIDQNTVALYKGATLISNYTVTGGLPVASWFWLEMRVKLDPTAGRVVMRAGGVGGLTIIDYTGDTGAADPVTWAYLRGLNSGNTSYFADFHLLDGIDGTTEGQVAAYNTMLGDVRVRVSPVNSAGAATQMTPSTGTNFGAVDELPVSMTDYVTGSTGQRDTYGTTDLVNPGTIYGVQNNIYAQKTDAGALSVKGACLSGGTVYYGPTVALGASVSTVRSIRTKDPATNAAWSTAGYNAAEFGAEVV